MKKLSNDELTKINGGNAWEIAGGALMIAGGVASAVSSGGVSTPASAVTVCSGIAMIGDGLN